MQVTTNAVDTHSHDMMRGRIAAAIASLLAALAASSCCLLPLVLFTLGVGGAWISNLVRLAPLQPYFIAVAAVSLGTGYWLVQPSLIACAGHATCRAPIVNRLVTSVLVMATVLVVLAITFKFLAPLTLVLTENAMTRLLISLVLGLLVSAHLASAAERTVTLTVDNMYCEACPYMLKKTLERVSGVSKINVSFKDKTAVVVFDDEKARLEDLTSATAKAGFPSQPKG